MGSRSFPKSAQRTSTPRNFKCPNLLLRQNQKTLATRTMVLFTVVLNSITKNVKSLFIVKKRNEDPLLRHTPTPIIEKMKHFENLAANDVRP